MPSLMLLNQQYNTGLLVKEVNTYKLHTAIYTDPNLYAYMKHAVNMTDLIVTGKQNTLSVIQHINTQKYKTHNLN